MQKELWRKWINALKEDFPEHINILNHLDEKIELQFELVEDYYFCKQQIKKMEGSGEHKLLKEFINEFEDQKEEIRLLLTKFEAIT